MARKRHTRSIYVGIDTHRDTHHAAVITATGERLGDREFEATTAGYRQLLEFVRGFGQITRFGIEGTGSYGAGLSAFLREHEQQVRDVIPTKRPMKRRRGKTDREDAYLAASAAAADSGQLATAKTRDGHVEMLRTMMIVRNSAVEARKVAITQLKALLISAPAPVRERFSGLGDAELIRRLAALRPGERVANPTNATLHALRDLARRHRMLSPQITDYTNQIRALIAEMHPGMLERVGIGPISAAQLIITAGDNPERLTSKPAFAMLCGAAPIPAKSGLTHRHRLNRGGDRQANKALHQIAHTRLKNDPRTRAYAEQQYQKNKTRRDVMRKLKHAITREIYDIIVKPLDTHTP